MINNIKGEKTLETLKIYSQDIPEDIREKVMKILTDIALLSQIDTQRRILFLLTELLEDKNLDFKTIEHCINYIMNKEE